MGEERGRSSAVATALGRTAVDGATLTRRQRSVIAALIFHRQSGASTETVIDAVWGEEVPGSARQSLQNQIARLRARFGTDLIVTDAAGYHLGRACDVDDFERTLHPALRRPASADAVSVLETCLRAWRGTPYIDLPDHHGVDIERARLVELHAQGVEHLAAARLAAGDARRAVPELAALTEDDPYRERRWELLMLALQVEGRRTEALAVFARAARRFALDLGTQPSRRMQRLRARIERGEEIDLTAEADLVLPEVVRCSAGRARRRPLRCGVRSSP